ncbi:sigma factor-like helix-turn-helix DNA-binding protein [Nocardia asteroides]|uniref:sigma factor-like helix-turn-helix DNA-binding protein n=1 Tax=Nocardia asteroides TaxID=1824 RepID=UPI003402C161
MTTTLTEVQKARLRALKVSRLCAKVLVAGAFALSGVALWQLAVAAHIPWWLAWIWPVVIDGSIYQSSTAVMALAGRTDDAAQAARRWFQWMIGGGVALSMAANGLHAWTMIGNQLSWWQIAIVAVVPPLLLLAATHGVTILAGLDAVDTLAEVGAEVDEGQAVIDAEVEPEPSRVTVERVAEAAPVVEHQAVVEAAPQRAIEPAGAQIEKSVSDALDAATKGHSPRRTTRDPEQVRRALELAGNGLSSKEIAAELAVTDRTVRRYLKEAAEAAEAEQDDELELPAAPRLHLEVVNS